MPTDVVDTFGYALHLAQNGGKHAQAKPLKGFGSAGVLKMTLKILSSPKCKAQKRFRSAAYSTICKQEIFSVTQQLG